MDAIFAARPPSYRSNPFASIVGCAILFTCRLGSGQEPTDVNIIRGPYLQSGTMTNIIVCWRTDLPTPSRVAFGRAAGNLPWSVFDSDAVTDHRVTLTNLAPNTKYYYSVGTSGEALASGPDHYFITAPSAPKPTRIWAIGDCGTAAAGDFGSWLVRDAYYNFAGTRETDVWLMLGDNAYGYGTDSQYGIAVFNTYHQLLRRCTLWSAIGNHETYAPIVGEPIAYFDIFSLPTDGRAGGVPSGSETYYSFDYANIHFVCIDSEIASREPGGPMLNWLESDLDATTKDWIIAFWHSPPYTMGSHNSDSLFDNGGNMTQMRANVVPVLERYGVDLVLCGHSHDYERSHLIYGHYGFSWELEPSMIKDSGTGREDDTGAYRKALTGSNANQGAIYVVAGSSGWATFQTGRHPVMQEAILERGSLVVDIDGLRLDAKFLRETGAIDDYFTIIKGDAAEPFRLAKFTVQGGFVNAHWKSEAGKTYRIVQKTSLESGDWTDASEDIVATGATTSWTGFAPDSNESYFRVRLID